MYVIVGFPTKPQFVGVVTVNVLPAATALLELVQLILGPGLKDKNGILFEVLKLLHITEQHYSIVHTCPTPSEIIPLP